ncbi:MAG TPA: DUF1343 domain-containing protein [Chitinophagaceae bacterium]|nr:DUF1343 domain-containing protein [Chitinophagaceae bacterium]
MKKIFLLLFSMFFISVIFSQHKNLKKHKPIFKKISPVKISGPILPGAYQTDLYLPLLKDKRVAVFANHTATLGNSHLVDSLIKLGINIVVAFGPEHGFRGTADAGEKVDNYTDSATGINVISLYGKKTKPTADDLKDVDVMLFDIQDVGTRFYTYISSLQDYLEAAIVNNKPLIVLDRPNPNGFYVDGPVLDTTFKSHIGMQPIPTVYGMTMGEYALYLIGERLKYSSSLPTAFEALFTEDLAIRRSKQKYFSSFFSVTGAKKIEPHFDLIVVPCKNYSHNSKYILPVKPSPNLPDMASVYWYASHCLFEGTVLSEGRGTDHPFAIFGHPSLPNNLFSFTPTSREGAKEPKLKDQLCYGWNLSGTDEEVLKQINNRIQLKYLLEAYKLFPDKEHFFIAPKNGNAKNYSFNRLAGNSELMAQIKSGKTEAEIRASWQPKLKEFKAIRKLYLLYPDFE